MIPLIQKPEPGKWYLSVTCLQCDCKLLLLPDLNGGKGNIMGIFGVTCPQCKLDQSLPAEHYHHLTDERPLHLGDRRA